jgi:hypothetical protein
MSQQSYYDEIKLEPPKDPRRLVFVATAGAPAVPKEVTDLRESFTKLARVINIFFIDDPKERTSLFGELHMAADRGLRGPEHNLEDGKSNLEEVKIAAVDAAPVVLRRQLDAYRKIAFWGFLPLLLALIQIQVDPFKFQGSDYATLLKLGTTGLLLVAGCAFGLAAEFILRAQDTPSFDDLLNLDPGRWRPTERLFMTVVIAAVFAFLLQYDAVQIGFGKVLLNEFATEKPELAVLVGGITAVAFSSVRDIIYRLKPEEKK